MAASASRPAAGDALGYGEIRNLTAETAKLRAVHHHDWSPATHDQRWKMISGAKNPFSAESDYSVLVVTDRWTGQLMFRAPVPALTRLWISPDSRYILGLSEIMLWNPYQLVLFDREGHLLFRRHISSQETQFTPAEYEELLANHPKAKPELERLTTRESGGIFVDLGDPTRLHGAWDILYRHLHRLHYFRKLPRDSDQFRLLARPHAIRPRG